MPFKSVYERFDATFVTLLGFQYFNQGTKVLVYYALASLFKEKFQLDPGYVAILTSVINFPWSIKILYGIISDNFPIRGSHRRAYLIILSIV